MSISAVVGSTPLDDFLNDSSSSETGELLQRVGLFGSLFGITLAVGLLVFLAVVHRGSRAEVGTILRVITLAGGATMLGAATELAGVASIGDLSWSDALTDDTGSAPMVRLLGGLLVVLGLFDHTVPADEPLDDGAADEAVDESDDRDVGADPDGDVRWVPASASAFGLVGALLGVVSFWFDGHTVTRGPRVVHAVVDLAHVVGGGVWFGGIVGLCILALLRRGTSIAPVIVRFSPVASVALVVVALAGSLMTLMVIDGIGDLTGTEWGRLLLVKVAAVGVTALVGAYNHFVVVPALEVAPSDGAMVARARSTVVVETALLTLVVAVTVFLTSASIN